MNLEIFLSSQHYKMESERYTQGMLEEAIGLVQSKAISLNEASCSFGIPLSTLGDKVRGRRPIKARSKFLLTEDEEAKLSDWLVIFPERSLGRTVEDLKDKVKEILELRGDEGRRSDGRPGKDWVRSFRKRHPELTIRTPQNLGKERALVTEEDVEAWFTTAKAYLDRQDPDLLKSADRIYNTDETGFGLSPGQKRIIAPMGIKHLYSMSNSTRQTITVLACGGASGEFLRPLIVYARKRMPATNLLDGFEEAFMQISHNGWMNSQIFKTWINDIFIPHVAKKKKPVVLFVDGHCSHKSDLERMELCDNNGIILYGLLPHAFHIVQPLDLTVYSSMKAEWPKAVHRHMQATGEVATVNNFAKIVKMVWDKCARPEIILKGFIRSGIYPFRPEIALESGKMSASKNFLNGSNPSTVSSSPTFTCDCEHITFATPSYPSRARAIFSQQQYNNSCLVIQAGQG